MANTFQIAGHTMGAKVVGNTNTVQPIYEALASMAASGGNYWAREAVNALRSLESGHVKDNVFVNETLNQGGRTEFDMILPGCKAKVLKRPNGEYLVYAIEADTSYDQMQQEGKKPGLFEAQKQGTTNSWGAALIPTSTVKNKQHRVVAITDRSKQSPSKLASNIAPRIAESPISGGGITLDAEGFDFHYTSGNGKIGGLKNLKQAFNSMNDPELNESAIQLAQAMKSAQKIKNVRWISIEGGSGVLTQAMAILKQQNINFSESGHYVFMQDLTTLATPAENLARSIGLKFDRQAKSISRTSLNQWVGGTGLGVGSFIASWNRFRQDPEHTALKLGADITKEVTDTVGGIKTVQTTAIASAVSMGILTVASGGTGITIPASLTFASAVIASTAKFGPTMLKAWAPNLYYKIKGKL